MNVDIVVPSAGRPSLARLLEALGQGSGPLPGRVLVVHDRPGTPAPALGASGWLAGRIEVLPGAGAGPAAARNLGWRASSADWVAFLDDDVVPGPDWLLALRRDLEAAEPEVGGSQGRVDVPLPSGRAPTDWERNVAGLAAARWITADLAYRRTALAAVGGFDERFPRAYREDVDLGLRVTGAGWRIVRGDRRVEHPVRPAGPLQSARLQAGNADDMLMRALHGRSWRRAAGAPAGRRPRHVAVTVAGAIALAARRVPGRRLGPAGAAAWAIGTAEFALRRIAPGPRTPRELATMVITSALIPPLATLHTLRGLIALPKLLHDGARAPRPARPPDGHPRRPVPLDAVLLDRDGTLIVDVPYNGDPARVVPMPGARAALDRLRGAGVRLGVVSNQSGVARGLLVPAEVHAVNSRVEELLGPLGPWAVCPHGPEDGCACRKPAPGLVLRAAAELGVDPRRCAVVGDIGADVEAARAAGARAVLVPTPRTRPEEVRAAPVVARDLPAAVDGLIGGVT